MFGIGEAPVVPVVPVDPVVPPVDVPDVVVPPVVDTPVIETPVAPAAITTPGVFRVLDIRRNLFAQVTTREEATTIANSIDGGMVVEVTN